jgi:hypothetical protein
MLGELNGEVGHDNVFIAANTNRVSFDFLFNPQQYGTLKLNNPCTPSNHILVSRYIHSI